MMHRSNHKDPTPDEQRANVSAIEANLAVEGLHMNPEDKALLMRSIDEGWSHEETMRRILEQLQSRDVIPAQFEEAPAAAAE